MEKVQDTHQILLTCAREEFYKNGYKSSSLRNICKKAEVTTGAVYFLFGSKEGLFSALVDPFVNLIINLLSDHVQQERIDIKNHSHFNDYNDIDVSQAIAHAYYSNKEIAIILLEKSEGTKYENFIDRIISMLEKEFYDYNEDENTKIDPWILHWFSHLIVDSFVQTILHFDTEKEALPRLISVTEIMQSVWYKIFTKN